MKKIITLVLTLSILVGSVNIAYAAEPTIKDISKNWAKDNIQYLINQRYVYGYPDGTFKPNNPVSVIEFIKLATLAAGFKLESGWKVWYENYLNKALEKGLITEGEFPDLNAPLTREQAARIAFLTVMLNEEAPSQENDELIAANFRDFIKVSDDKKQDVINAYNIGLMEGTPDGNFNPKGTLTRAEMTTVIIRIMDKAKRKPFDPNNSNAIILKNIYSGLQYTISRPEKKEEIKLAYIMQEARSKSKGWYYVSFAPEVQYIISGFYDSEESFKQSDNDLRMALSIDFSRNDNLVSTYYMVVYDPAKVKAMQRDSIAEAFKLLFEQDYEKAMAVFDKYIEEGVNGTAKISDIDYTFNSRKINFYRPNASGEFAINIYKKVK